MFPSGFPANTEFRIHFTNGCKDQTSNKMGGAQLKNGSAVPIAMASQNINVGLSVPVSLATLSIHNQLGYNCDL